MTHNDPGPWLGTRNRFAFELLQGLHELAEEGGDSAAYDQARDAYRRVAGIPRHLTDDLATRAFYDLDECAHAWANAMFGHGIEAGMAFAAYRDALLTLFPEKVCARCRGVGTTGAVDCGLCQGAGYVPARFGPEANAD